MHAGDVPIDELKHYGVKGMKWGVRKQRTLDTYTRVAEGKGSALDVLGVVGSMSLLELAAAKGSYKNVAAGRARGLQAQKDRIESGRATVADKIDRAMNTSIYDLARNK